MNKKEMEVVVKAFYAVERFKNELLTLCEGQSVSMANAVLLAAADELIDTAQEIRERTNERKSVWDLIKDKLEET